MRRISQYLLGRLSRGYVVALIAVGALFWLMEMLQRFEELDRAGLRLLDMALDALMTVPGSLVVLAPVVVVMATAGVMGALQNQRELVVMRVSGISRLELTRLALVPALVLGLAALAVSEWVSPLLERPVSQAGMDDLGEAGLMDEAHGLWSRSSGEFLNVREIRVGLDPRDIRIYSFDDQGRLIRHIRAASAQIRAPDRWMLENVVIRRFDGTEPASESLPLWEWQSFLSGDDLELLRQPPSSLSLSELWVYVQGLLERDEEALEFELFLWRRITLPLACLAMALVAVGSVTGNARTRSLSMRISIALGIGIAYQLITEVVSYAGLLMRSDPLLVAVLPPTVLAVLGCMMILRQR